MLLQGGKIQSFPVFDDSKQLDDFLDISNKRKIEYGIFEKFYDNRVLFTAEHAHHFKIPKPEFGEKAFIGIGDRNTDKLGKLMAFRIKSGFIVFNVPRTEADASRPIDALGKDEKLLVAIVEERKVIKKLHIPIHQNKKYLSVLKKYHRTIKDLNPRMIVSVHGIHARHKADIVIGAGKEYEMVGGKESANLLKNIIEKRVEGTLTEGLDVRFGKVFTGEKNYVLWKHVISYNKKNDKKRFGMQIEFNMRGRIVKKDNELISEEYRVGAQAIADSVLEWLNKR